MSTNKKPPWSTVKQRVVWGDMPEIGDELVFRSGRRYQVISINGKTIRCLVLPPGAEVQGRQLEWQWAKR